MKWPSETMGMCLCHCFHKSVTCLFPVHISGMIPNGFGSIETQLQTGSWNEHMEQSEKTCLELDEVQKTVLEKTGRTKTTCHNFGFRYSTKNRSTLRHTCCFSSHLSICRSSVFHLLQRPECKKNWEDLTNKFYYGGHDRNDAEQRVLQVGRF